MQTIKTIKGHCPFKLYMIVFQKSIVFGLYSHVYMYNLLCVDLVLDHQEAAHELDDNVRMKVREALLKRHHHQSDKKRNNLLPMVRSLTDSGRKQSEPHHMDKSGELNCTFYMCIMNKYYWLNTT